MEKKWGELASLLAVRRMRRANARRWCNDTDEACLLEWLWMLHRGFITILAACFLMLESYHATFLSVKRGFFCPLNISQLVVRKNFSYLALLSHAALSPRIPKQALSLDHQGKTHLRK